MIDSKSNVKSYFQTGDIPTENQFVDLIDSSTVPLANNAGHFSTSVPTDASTADIFRITADTDIILENPINCPDGKAITWEITQGVGGNKAITLGDKFLIPTSASNPLVFSNVAGYTDVLAARYNSYANVAGKFYVISMVPGYI